MQETGPALTVSQSTVELVDTSQTINQLLIKRRLCIDQNINQVLIKRSNEYRSRCQLSMFQDVDSQVLIKGIDQHPITDAFSTILLANNKDKLTLRNFVT